MPLTYSQTIIDPDDFRSPAYNADEFVRGGSAAQTIDTGRGNDRVEAGGGNDTVEGGEGDDYIDGGADDDILSGGYGKDLLVGGSGDDILRFDQTDFIDANGRSVDGGPGLQDRLGQGAIYDGGSGFDLVAVRNTGSNKATDGNVADEAGFDRVFQLSTAANRDLRSVEGLVVDYADDKAAANQKNDLVRHSLGEINANKNTGTPDGDFVAYLGGGTDKLEFVNSSGWTLTGYAEGSASLDADQVALIRSAGRFGSDGAKVSTELDTYTFTNGGGAQVTVYTDAELVTVQGVAVDISPFG